MPRASEVRTNFTAGELSPLVDARTQFNRYYNGSITLENFIPRPQGPAFRRKGFKFINETKDSSKASRLIPFEYSTSQTYVIELGDQYMRFYSGQGLVLDGSSNHLEISSPYLEAEIFDVKFVQDSDVMYLAHPNHPVQKLIRVSENSFTLNDVDFQRGPFDDENTQTGNFVTITASSWSEGDSGTLTATGGHTPFTSNHVGGLWRVENGSNEAFLKITGYTSNTVVSVTFQNDIPSSLRSVARFQWNEGEFSDARSHPTAITFHEQRLVLAGTPNAPQKLFFSTSNADYENFEAGTEDNEAFLIKIAANKGDPIRWLHSDEVLFVGTSNGIFRATSSANGSVLTPSDIDVKKHISYGCSNIQPELVGSAVIYMQKGDNKARGINFSIQSDKYSALDLTVDSEHIVQGGVKEIDYQQDPISTLWAVKNNGEIARLTSEEDQEVIAWSRFTTQGEFESCAIVNSSDDNDEIYAISKRTINGAVKRFVEVQEPNYDVDNLNRVFVDSYLSYNGTGAVTLTLDSSNGLYALAAESGELLVTETGELKMTELLSVNFQSSSAYFSSGDVGKEIHEIGTGTGRAEITAFVDTQNVTVTIIEPFSKTTFTSGEWALAITTVSGLDHLIGATVSICSDGATEPDQVVNGSGEITLSNAGSIVHVGLSYTSTQKSMPIEMSTLQGVIGTSQHKISRITRANVRFSDTNGGKIVHNSNTILIPARSTNDNMNETPPLFSGDREVVIGGNPDTIVQLSVIQDGPQPMTIKSINYNVDINDK